MCVCVCVCVCAISRGTFLHLQYIYLYHTCVLKSVWSCLVTDNFGLFTEIAVCKFLRGWRSYGPKPFLFCPLYVYTFFLQLFVGIMRHRNVHYCSYYYVGCGSRWAQWMWRCVVPAAAATCNVSTLLHPLTSASRSVMETATAAAQGTVPTNSARQWRLKTQPFDWLLPGFVAWAVKVSATHVPLLAVGWATGRAEPSGGYKPS